MSALLPNFFFFFEQRITNQFFLRITAALALLAYPSFSDTFIRVLNFNKCLFSGQSSHIEIYQQNELLGKVSSRVS